ncbi:MAG: PfkB family carbohydrate kinase [Solirubrobacteraceae bacterium]
MSYAVVGHVEWVQFARVAQVPRAGEIVHSTDCWEEAAGGGAVAAVQLARLAGSALLFCALGTDELGDRALARLRQLGVTVHAARRQAPTRRAWVHLDARHERTITTLGERLTPSGEDALPWEELRDMRAVYVTAGDAAAIRAARAAPLLVASPRSQPQCPVDALVLSAGDSTEEHAAASIETRLRVETNGAHGGIFSGGGSWQVAPLQRPPQDTYGCGDSFAAGLTYALGTGIEPRAAVALAARCGAACLTGAGPYEAQLRAAQLRAES